MVPQQVIGARIRAARIEAGYSQESFAEALRKASGPGSKLDQTAVSRWERGKGMSVEQLQLIADVLKVPKADLLAEDTGSERSEPAA